MVTPSAGLDPGELHGVEALEVQREAHPDGAKAVAVVPHSDLRR